MAAERLCCDSFPFNHIFLSYEQFAKYLEGANFAAPAGNQGLKSLQLERAKP